jgi:hypothetical protein
MDPAFPVLGWLLAAPCLLSSTSCGRDALLKGANETPRPDAALGSDAALVRHDDAASPKGDVLWTSCVPPPASSCVRGPLQPASLAVLTGIGSVFDIVPLGERLIAGGLVNRPLEETPQGRFIIIELATGALSSRDLPDSIPGSMWSTGPALVYRPGIPRAIPEGWDFSYDELVRWDLDTNQEIEIEQPAGWTVAPYGFLATNARGEIFCEICRRGSASCGIAMWNPCTRTSSLMAESFLVTSMGADASTLYWTGRESSGPLIVSSMPIAGGPASVVRVSTYEVGDLGPPWWVGMDDSSLYYVAGPDQATRIAAMPKTGGSGHTVVPDAYPLFDLRFDDANIYWGDNSDPSALRRTPKDGGQTDILWSAPNRWIQDIAVDDCNVYWMVANPFEVFYLAR